MESPQNNFDLFITFAIIVGIALLHLYFLVVALVVRRARSRRIQVLADAQFPFAKRTLELMKRKDQILFTTHLGRFLAVLALGWYLRSLLNALAFSKIGHDITLFMIERGFNPMHQELVMGVLVVVFFVIALTVLTQVLRSIATRWVEQTLCVLWVPIRFIDILFTPIRMPLDKWSRRLIKLFGLKGPVEGEQPFSSEEIADLAERSSEAGEIEDDEGEMVRSVLAMSETTVQEIMTPRQDIVAVKEGSSLEEILALIKESGKSRLLVISDELDDVKGVLLAKDLLSMLGKKESEFSTSKFSRVPYFTPQDKKIDDLLQEFQQRAVHFAVVLDEHGGVDGIVTLEDLLEEIVGEMFDESDVPSEELEIVEERPGRLMLDGGALIDELNQDYDCSLPEGEYHTIAGFVIHSLGCIPVGGEEVRYNGSVIKVEQVEQNRIISVSLTHIAAQHDELAAVSE